MIQIARRTFELISHSLTERNHDEMRITTASPEAILLQEIPGHKSYSYAVIGSQRVIVDSATYAVIYRLN
ncbi:DUF1236 domain-containing protein [Microvirga sp. 2YAF29]|uniref:DUF1236 domain-containing protein n=1 Tax=Microvirga sp. 2YAF29 TaxID=3233031 RepID=UPI003F9C3E12